MKWMGSKRKIVDSSDDVNRLPDDTMFMICEHPKSHFTSVLRSSRENASIGSCATHHANQANLDLKSTSLASR